MRRFRQLSRNARTAVIMFGLAFGMVGVAYASVPLYRLFCQVTGFGGTTMRAAESDVPGAVGRMISVRFDGNVSPALGWEFRPVDHIDQRQSGASSSFLSNSGRSPISTTICRSAEVAI